MDIWVLSTVWLLQILHLGTCVSKELFLACIRSGETAESLLILCLPFQGTVTQPLCHACFSCFTGRSGGAGAALAVLSVFPACGSELDTQ